MCYNALLDFSLWYYQNLNMKMKRLARFTGRGKNKKKEQKEVLSPKISSPVIEERKPKISSPVIEERKEQKSNIAVSTKISSPVINKTEQPRTVSKTTETLTNSAPPAKRDQKPTYLEETIVPPPRTYPAGIVEQPCSGLVIENPYENHDLIEEHQVMDNT